MTTRTVQAIETVPHEVHRLAIAVQTPFDEFRRRYEAAVPRFDMRRVEGWRRDGADWGAIVEETTELAAHGFLIYWSFDGTGLMGLAGDSGCCVEYLMGNHTIAQRMYRQDPAILLYAPLRTAIYVDAEGATRFAIDQPSTRFASFGDPAITAVGIELDRKVAALLESLGAPVPAALTR
jgi:hypothetical protein